MQQNFKYIMYLRKSTESEDRQVASIEDQRKELLALAAREGLEIIATYQESKSAHEEGREQFGLLIKDFENGRADGLLVWHCNRIARNANDGAKVITLIDTKHIKQIKTLSGTFHGYPSDKLMLGLEFLMSKKYSDDLSEVVTRGIKNKFMERKQWICLAKPGYSNKRDEFTGQSKIIVDAERFALLQRAGHTIIEGKYTANEVLHLLNNEWGYRTKQRRKTGGKEMAKSSYYRFLSDPYYYGLMQAYIDGEIREEFGTHEPMFTKKEWDLIQIRLGKDMRRNVVKHAFAYRGLIACGECGSAIVAQEKWQVKCSVCRHKFHKGKDRTNCPSCQTEIVDMREPKISHYIYYGCTKKKTKTDGSKCSQKYVELAQIEDQIRLYLDSITIDEDYKNWAIDHLNELHEQEATHYDVVVKNINSQVESITKRLNNLLQLKISVNNADGSMLSDEEYNTQRTALVNERTSLLEQLNGVSEDQDEYIALTKETFDFACYAKYWFDHGSEEKRTQILQSLGYNFLLRDRRLEVGTHKPFFLIEKFNTEVREIVRELEPGEKIDLKEQNALSNAVCSKLSEWADSNRRPLRPERSALPPALHSDVKDHISAEFLF